MTAAEAKKAVAERRATIISQCRTELDVLIRKEIAEAVTKCADNVFLALSNPVFYQHSGCTKEVLDAVKNHLVDDLKYDVVVTGLSGASKRYKIKISW